STRSCWGRGHRRRHPDRGRVWEQGVGAFVGGAWRDARRRTSRRLSWPDPSTRAPLPMTPSRAASGFAYTREQFQAMVEDVLAQARALGASDAGVEVSEGAGLSVSVRM